MVGGKIDIVPCENGFEKNSRSNDASGVFLSQSKKRTCRFELPAIQRNSCRTALHQS